MINYDTMMKFIYGEYTNQTTSQVLQLFEASDIEKDVRLNAGKTEIEKFY